MHEPADALMITGASGRLGAALALHLRDRYRVVAFDRAGPSLPPEGVETINLDLSTDEGVQAAFGAFRDRHGDRVASVLHFAAYYDFTGDDDPRYEQVNVEGSARLIRGLRKSGLRSGQFVYASSMVVHAPGEPGRPITEASPTGPTIPYARSKLRAEEALKADRDGTPLVILRLANVYDDEVHHPVLAQQFVRAYERKPGHTVYPGDPARGQSYLHLDDLLDAVDRVVDRRMDLPDVLALLLGEPGATSYGAIQDALGRELHGSVPGTLRVPKALAKLGVRARRLWPFGPEPFVHPWMVDRAGDHYELDVSEARDRLGWSPSRSLLDRLPAMTRSLRDDPAAWYRSNDLEPPRSAPEGGEAEDRAKVDECRREDHVHHRPGSLDLAITIEYLDEKPEPPGQSQEPGEEPPEARGRHLGRGEQARQRKGNDEQGNVQVMDVEDLPDGRRDLRQVLAVGEDLGREQGRDRDQGKQAAGDPQLEDQVHRAKRP